MPGILIAHIVMASVAIVAFIAALVYVISVGVSNGYFDDDSGAVFGFAGLFAIPALILGPLSIGVTDQYSKVKFEHIVSIDRTSEVEGHFALGCGTIDSREYYYFYVDCGVNKYKLERLAYDITYIIEDNTKTPSVYEVKEYGKNFNELTYNIYVPEGTIVKEFHL